MTHQQSLFERNYFLHRRLHSLTGIVPVGLFLIFHLTTNGSVLWGQLDSRLRVDGNDPGVATFQHEVDFIHSTPFLLLLEVFGIWLPIAYHSVLGVYFAVTGKSNVSRYAYQDNWRYTWQRITAYIGLVFIFWHIATLRWGWVSLIPSNWGAEPAKVLSWNGEHAASSMAAIMQGGTEGMMSWGLVHTAAYAIGTVAMVFHFANGLWTAAITWGLTVSAAAQKRWGWICLGLGAGLMVMGLGAVFKFATLNYEDARKTELKLREKQSAAGQEPSQVVVFGWSVLADGTVGTPG
ncbi:MAG: succinate dehydrogenase cytochrome b558 subunit [Phycisphaerales bacterium]|nr:succinate dehydrogenase cytochrome b558 subunit [Phycisphaerales bacterium]